jgi:hypothetical protein
LRRVLRRWSAGGGLDRAGRWLGVLLLVAGCGASFYLARQKLALVAVTPAERAALLEERVHGYAVMNYLREHATGKVYQIALSEATYYGPSPVWGDAIGPWRYADFIVLPPAEFARKLAGLGFEAVAANAQYAAYLESRPGFLDHFALMYEKDGAKAYRILPFKQE